MQYKILMVNPTTREYSTKFGDMVSYQVKFEGMEIPVEISKKTTSPAPQPGDEVTGTIDMSAKFGPKFKADFGGNAGGFTSPTASSSSTTSSTWGSDAQDTKTSTGTKSFDQFTMYLSYAKDLIVALQETGGYDEAKYNELLTATVKGGKALYTHRPGAEPTETAPDDEKQPDATKISDAVDDFFKDTQVVELEEDPWAEKPKK